MTEDSLPHGQARRWHPPRDSNPHLAVLETAALPIELGGCEPALMWCQRPGTEDAYLRLRLRPAAAISWNRFLPYFFLPM